MRGYFVSFFSVLGVVMFSFCLFLSGSLSLFWLFLELGTLSLVPSFFFVPHEKVLSGLFSYLIVSSVSSSFIICGFLFYDLLFLSVVGFLIKFGVFPFFGWVYKVIESSNWLVVWLFSTFLKCPVLFFSFFLSCGGFELVTFLSVSSFVFLASLFWVYSYSWFHCWAHMMLSSSVSLVAMSVTLSSSLVFWLFVVYLIWSSLVIIFLSYCSNGFLSVLGLGSMFFLVGLVVSYPLSLSLFYKLLMSFCMLSCPVAVLFSWAVYSVSEQFFLLKYFMGLGVSRWAYGVWSLV